jgi:ATP-dependent DNA helicase RecQ
MTPDERRRAQDEFATQEGPVIVATVAFGMGIDRPDVRFVVHTAMPKSVEHYQQEIGRAGRDGLPAECVLLYSGGDVPSLRSMIEKSATENGAEAAFLPAALAHLNDMDRYCRGAVCRHKALVRYFGQDYGTENCGACDLCLGDTQEVPDATVVAQKILSCVARVKESFGVGHVVAVLKGDDSDAVRNRGHDRLSTYGLLKDVPRAALRDWVYQLIGQELLAQVGDEYPVLRLNPASWEVLKGARQVRLIQLARREKKSRRAEAPAAPAAPEPLTVSDAGLFDRLRALRREIAATEGVPAYRVFPDTVLLALSRSRPTTPDGMRQITGVGEVKLRAYGAQFLEAIRDYTASHPPDATPVAPALVPPMTPAARKQTAFARFREGVVVEDVMHELSLARSTVCDYLVQFVQAEKPAEITAWVPDDVYQEVSAAAQEVGATRLKPIFDALGGQVSYDAIRLVLAHRAATGHG